MSRLNSTTPPFDTLQQAAEWFVVINDKQVSEQTRVEWRQWLAARPSHSQAWEYVEKVHSRFQAAEQVAGNAPLSRSLKAAQKDRLSRRKLLQSGGALCLLGLIGWQHAPLRTYAQHYTAQHRTTTGKIDNIQLADKGQLWLNSASSVNIDYSENQRKIVLVRGEVLLETAKDSLSRPLVVSSQHGHMTALGTVFNVLEQNDHTLLAVYEGAVEIETLQGHKRVINAGQQARFSAHAIRPAETADPARRAWTTGVILADDIPLQQLVDQINRYHSGHISVDSAVANLTIMGTFPADRPEHTLNMLTSNLPVRIDRTTPWWINISEK